MKTKHTEKISDANHHDKLRIAQTKQQKNKNKKSQITKSQITNHKLKQAPSLISTSQTSTTQSQLPKPTSQRYAPLHTTNLPPRPSTFK
jgi:hypothetical protein